jgi:D-alanine-D-alanine ligase-like ATP-grasp enzyme
MLRVVDWLIDLNRVESSSRPFRFPTFFKIRHFEFWNTHLFHLPIYLYWLFLSIKARSFFFFSASNPGIETGGMMGESKIKIMQKINRKFLPKSIYYSTVPSSTDVLEDVFHEGISFPFIVKPDIGQGGWLIQKIHNLAELKNFLSRIKMPFIVQEFVDHSLEIGLLYYRLPGNEKGTISSLAVKELLNVVGDGKSPTIKLIQDHPRAKKQVKKLLRNSTIDFNRVPAKGEKVLLSFMANHSFGTTFRNYNCIIDEKLSSVFDELCKDIDGFYFGRFDLRCESLEELKNGNFKILELNGAGSEPLHIFDPSEKIANAYSSALEHWNIIYKISQLNKKAGAEFMKWNEAYSFFKNVQRIQLLHKTCFTIGN